MGAGDVRRGYVRLCVCVSVCVCVVQTTGLPSALAIQVPQQLGTFARAAHWRAYPRLTTAAQCAACPRQFHSPLNAHRCELRHEAGDALALAAPQQGKAGKGSKSSKRPGTVRGYTFQSSLPHTHTRKKRHTCVRSAGLYLPEP